MYQGSQRSDKNRRHDICCKRNTDCQIKVRDLHHLQSRYAHSTSIYEVGLEQDMIRVNISKEGTVTVFREQRKPF